VFKAWVCDRSTAGTTGSDPVRGIDVCAFECCVLSGRGLCDGPITHKRSSTECVFVSL
jgi:hypothetical protein